MSSSYLGKHLSQHGQTPQSEPMRADQVENSAGGFVWQIDVWSRLRRFLILGSEGGTYYASERDLTRENIDVVKQAIAEDGPRLVEMLLDVSLSGVAPKQQPTLLALAMACAADDQVTRQAAYAAITRICRTATMLFTFLGFVKTQRGWSRGLRTAVSRWYTRPWQEPEEAASALAYQMVKYRSREGYTHRDVLRLAHPKARSPQQAALFDWAARVTTHGTVNEQGLAASPALAETWKNLQPMVLAFEQAQASPSATATADLVHEHGLPREAVKPEHATDPELQMALLETDMPMTALMRNLGNLSKSELLRPMSNAEKIVLAQLSNYEQLRKARVHPIQVLMAMLVYKSGHSVRGSGTWAPVGSVVDALDAAFYEAFKTIEPSGKRTMLALDISGSMGTDVVAGVPGLTPRLASAAMAMVTARTETQWMAMGFATSFTPLTISPKQGLDAVVHEVSRLEMGGTDCALPMLWALGGGKTYGTGRGYYGGHTVAPKHATEIDTFVVYTDNETWAGAMHPKQALDAYRKQVNPDAKLIVVGMTSTGFSIADPNDAGMLDVVGFDSSAPAVMADFARN